MASSISFHSKVKNIIPIQTMRKLQIIPWSFCETKLKLIARRPLSEESLLELKTITGYQDYELQIVGDDVIKAYTDGFELGSIFSDYDVI